MSSPCRSTERRVLTGIACAALLCVLAAACDREEREYREDPKRGGAPKITPASAALQANAGAGYDGNAYHITQGGRLFRWFNCNGCHGAGGGAMGPALMDAQWRYGGSIAQIHATIRDGRPNGMPSFRARIPDQQLWQLAAYVRSLSGKVPKSAAPSRREGLQAIPPPSRTPDQGEASDPAAALAPAK
jgi:cytochrome c oxidase cbb3-type subunit 3